jgi:CBS domain containing-hemolysin-like protein
MEFLALPIALFLVALNGFFVATEFAIVKVRATRIEELLRKNRPGAAHVRHVIKRLDSYLSATQLGITLASLGLGWAGEPAFAHLIEKPALALGISDPHVIHSIALAVAFVTISFLHIVAGELAPKSLALLHAESVALAVAFPMRVFYTVFFPVIWLLNVVSNGLLRASGLTPSKQHHEHHSEEEIKIIVRQARSAGLLSSSRSDLLQKVLSLPTKTARSLMVPRSEVVFLDINASLAENLETAMQAGNARFPLCDQALDDVLGFVDARDLLYHSRESEPDLKRLAHPMIFIPETMSAERLLYEFRVRHAPMAVIVDEYGGTSGIATPADVIAAVMGEFDESDEGELVALPGGAYDVEGTASLEELEQTLRVPLKADDMRTVAGFLMARLGRMPRIGDRVSASGHTFVVMEMSGPKVRRVRIQKEKPPEASEPGKK